MNYIISWRSVLDIVLIATVLFFLYRTLIRLGTWKIVSGILIAVAVFIAASFLNLEGIEWIYRNVSHIAVLSLVIIFQPELRKLFERAASLSRSRAGRQDDSVSRLITENMWLLSSKRIGAIIVIPGNESITEWLSGGFPVDSLPSAPLIQSIFDPNSPGHDGALILDHNRFSDFGVRLPVSQSGRLSEEYGTRHQSAMGLSEQCDALVIVASEERGRVSVFHNGERRTMESESMLYHAISSHCGTCEKADSPQKMFNKLLSAEILGSLAVALIFWIALVASQREMMEKIITVPIEYTATSDEVTMVGEKPKDIRLHLAGTKADLDAVMPSSMSVKIDLSRSVAGTQSFLISEENITLPKGLRLVDVEPPNIDITMAKLVKTLIDIEPQLIGKLPEGFDMVSITAVPDKVSALLPSGERDQAIKTIITTPIYLANIRETTTVFCKIIASPSIQPLEKRWPDVTVHIAVKEIDDLKNLKKK